MARTSRLTKASEGNYYHVTSRGSGRRNIFDDDADRVKYLQDLFALVDESSGSLIAWCLMDNHVHLLFHLEINELSSLLHRLNTKYAQYFNGRYGHVGHVFQGRYDSTSIKSDEHLLLAVKYIHHNPKDIVGLDWKTYPWSSYQGYCDGMSHCETETVLEIAGGVDRFKNFHENGDVGLVDLSFHVKRLSDGEAASIIEQSVGPHYADLLAIMPRQTRDRKLAALHRKGLSIRQIERLTGVGRNTIDRAIKKTS